MATPSFAVAVSDPVLAGKFTQAELRQHRAQFDAADKLQTNLLSPEQLEAALSKQNITASPEEASKLVEKFDATSKGGVDFEGFLKVHLAIQDGALSGSSPKKGSALNKAFIRSTSTIYTHQVEDSEKQAYVDHINLWLRDDPVVGSRLPLNAATDELWDAVKDGLLLCKLINVAAKGTIDERVLNVKEKLNAWEKNENQTLCINSAKAIGCSVVNIGAGDLVEAKPHLVLGLISQIVKIQLLSNVSVKKMPELAELLDNEEEFDELCRLPAEKILLRWFNFHLKRAGYKKEITNFGADIKDGEAYTVLLHALAPEACDLSPLKAATPEERARLLLLQAEKLDARKYVQARDIVEGHQNLNLAFVANLFHTRSGLSLENSKVTFAEMLPDDESDSREERAFRMWINSLGIETYVNQVFDDLRDGYVLLEILNKVEPGVVNFKRVSKPPIKMPFKKVENCNYAVEIGKGWGFSLVNVSGNDFVQGNKKLILAFLWQLMRHSLLLMLKKLKVQGKELSDAEIVAWANDKVKTTGKASKMDSFRDKSLSSGQFFLDLLSAIEPRVVNWYLVTAGQTQEDKESNAKYIISVARKLGCSIFLLWDDIVEVRPKMIMTLTASIMQVSMKKKEMASIESS